MLPAVAYGSAHMLPRITSPYYMVSVSSMVRHPRTHDLIVFVFPRIHSCCRSVLHGAAHVPPRIFIAMHHVAARYAAAQFLGLPRTPWCHARQNASLSSTEFPRSSMCFRAVPRAAAHSMVPRAAV